MSEDAPTRYMLAALFHFERRGNRVRVTCSIMPTDWVVYARNVNEFLSCWRAAMEAFAETMGAIDRS